MKVTRRFVTVAATLAVAALASLPVSRSFAESNEEAALLQAVDALTKAMPSRQGIVEVFLRGERLLRHHMKAVRGTAENPMTREEVDTKSYDLMAPVLGRDRARRLCDAIWNLDRLKDVRKLRPLLKEKR